jgi:CTP-dependent riboflavin kinase
MIRGIVCKGTGQASRAFTEKRMAELQRLFGIRPVPGTLNVRVADLPAAVALLGEPAALTEHETRIGPLRWWPGSLSSERLHRPANVLLVRGEKSKAPYLEVVSQHHFRRLGLTDGSVVTLALR